MDPMALVTAPLGVRLTDLTAQANPQSVERLITAMALVTPTSAVLLMARTAVATPTLAEPHTALMALAVQVLVAQPIATDRATHPPAGWDIHSDGGCVIYAWRCNLIS